MHDVGTVAGQTLARHRWAEHAAELGDWPAAATAWEEALRDCPESGAARRGLILALAQLGRGDESLAYCATELAESDGEHWLGQAIVRAMERSDLSMAGCLASGLARTQRGEGRRAGRSGADLTPRFLTLPSLRHDIAQLQLLRDLGQLEEWADDAIVRYGRVVARYQLMGDSWRIPLAGQEAEEIGDTWGRLLHVEEGPRVERALSPHWDREASQRTYLERPPGVVVIDDFLTEEALTALEQFCVRSTIWFGNRYPDGRLGAFFFSGFNCPVLLQIAEEIQEALPRLIGPRYPLRQLWAFKNTGALPADSTIHADFAAINVNFWISPTEANLDPQSGGLRVYDLSAPRSWDFRAYNEGLEMIRNYIAARRPREMRIPYRRNRLVLFNSDLFHATEAVRFRPEYTSHRINVTLLYGDREQDGHHSPRPEDDFVRSSWRSPVFSRHRSLR